MPTFSGSTRRFIAATLLAAAGVAATTAQAQDVKLAPQAAQNVLWLGQSTQVNVWASFAPTAYAFAGAQFAVESTDPAWTFVSNGAIVGSDVLGINAVQQHAPHIGMPAAPANPIRIWTGIFTPNTAAPALVKISTLPGDCWVYPSSATPSSVPATGIGAEEYIFVNPLRIGNIFAAPGAGARMQMGDGSVRFVTDSVDPRATLLIGLLLPAVQKVYMEIDFDGPPDGLAVETHANPESFPIEQHSLNFTKIDFRYDVRMESEIGIGLGIAFLHGGRTVGSTESHQSELPFTLAELPDAIETTLGAARRVNPDTNGGANWQVPLTTTLHFDEPVVVVVRKHADSDSERLTADTIVIRSHMAVNNIKQLSLGLHSYEASGVERMILTPNPR